MNTALRFIFKRPMHWVALGVWLALSCGPVLAQVPLAIPGRIWDTRSQQFIGKEVLFKRTAKARYVLLGEKHDNQEHHALQLELLQALARAGVVPSLAMEQFDAEYQSALTTALAAGQRDPEALADAGKLDKEAWDWPLYKDLVGFAAQRSWHLLAANLSRKDARKIALGEIALDLPAFSPEQIKALEEDVVLGHCGYRPPAQSLGRIVSAQRARDARMAQVLQSVPGPVVLIAGAGHVRSDRAVPRYLAEPSQALTIAWIEVDSAGVPISDLDSRGFDVMWFTKAVEGQPDPCAAPLPGVAGPIPVAPSPKGK